MLGTENQRYSTTNPLFQDDAPGLRHNGGHSYGYRSFDPPDFDEHFDSVSAAPYPDRGPYLERQRGGTRAYPARYEPDRNG